MSRPVPQTAIVVPPAVNMKSEISFRKTPAETWPTPDRYLAADSSKLSDVYGFRAGLPAESVWFCSFGVSVARSRPPAPS